MFFCLPFLLLFIISEDGKEEREVSNFTIINLLLVWFGPQKEQTLTFIVLFVQIVFSFIAFAIRYPLAAFLYDELK